MDNQNARRCFYKGQRVKAQEINDLQSYSDRGQANLIASLLGYGVVNGFEISIIEGHIVGVTAGLAFNLTGERLVLAEGQQVNLAQYIPNVGEKTIKLGIIQDFIKTDPATDSMGNAEYTKWVPSVQFVLGESLDTGVFLLAEIKINPVSIVEIKVTSVSFTTLQKQIQNTSALNTREEGATMQSALLSLLAQNSISLDSPLINLITQNLQINGIPYMEIGSNDNGHYVKFESGLLVCISVNGLLSGLSYQYTGVTYPYLFSTPPLVISALLKENNEYLHTLNNSFQSLVFLNVSCNSIEVGANILSNGLYTPIVVLFGHWK